jgi:hypothetical protein
MKSTTIIKQTDDAAFVAGSEQLFDALYSNFGLQHMVDVAYELLGNPVFVNDSIYKILAMSKEPLYNDPTLEEEKTLGYVHNSNVIQSKKDKLTKTGYPEYRKKMDSQYGWIISGIYIHDVEVGQVALYENNKPLREIDYKFIDRFAKLVSIEMQKNTIYESNLGTIDSYFLDDLLNNKIRDKKTLQERLSFINWVLDENLYIISISGHNLRLFDSKYKLLSAHIRNILVGSKSVLYDNRLVFLISRSKQNGITITEQENLLEYLEMNNLSAGISNVFTNALDSPKYYNHAFTAAELGEKIHKGKIIYKYSDYAIYHLLEICSLNGDIQDFCHPAVFSLMDYDKKKNTNLLVTLSQYLLYVENPTQASENLHIHRNTLFYRIDKIKQLTGINLNDGDERLKLQLSLKILELKNV